MKIRECLYARGLPEGWESVFTEAEIDIEETTDILQEEFDKDRIIAPTPDKVFEVFYLLPRTAVKVVMVGQSPYPDINTACGIAFSQPDQRPRDSLKNMIDELQRGDPNVPEVTNGDLTPWVRQGVLLLNTSLTVDTRDNKRCGYIWMGLVDIIITSIQAVNPRVIFVLMGGSAQELKRTIANRGVIVECAHPSPANGGGKHFVGCDIFNKVNAELTKQKKTPIDWTLS
jgi:uracil-DNA glycosylase